jgi:hypothetical protein
VTGVRSASLSVEEQNVWGQSVWLVRVCDACLNNYYSEFEDCNESIQFNHLFLPVESIVI